MRGEHRAVLLDAMGTLLYLDEPVARLAERLELDEPTAARALRAEIAHYRAHIHLGRDATALAALRAACAEAMRPLLPPPAARLPPGELTAALLDALRFRAFPDSAPALQELRARGHALVVVSNWDVSLPERLAEAGLLDLVDAAVASSPLGSAKPARAIFAHALALARAHPAEAVHAGDDLHADVAGARAAGIRAVHVDRAGAGGAPAAVPVVRDLEELAALLAAGGPYA
jgi:putative hydrolase of the HAD superfamily